MSTDNTQSGGKAALVRTLGIARITLLGSSFGIAMTVAVMLVVGIASLLAGHTDVLHALGVFAPYAAAMIAAGVLGLPRLDRAIIRLVRGARGPGMVIPLLETLNMPQFWLLASRHTGPFSRTRLKMEEELAHCLETLDADYWRSHRMELGAQVKAAVAAGAAPSRLRPLDGPWFPALLDAIARCGRTELRGRVERLAAPAAVGKLPANIGEAARKCADALREREVRDRQAATLLRPSEEPPAGTALLRPAGYAVSEDEAVLLRPSDTGV